MPSRQRLQQIRNHAAGMCQNHKDRPVYKVRRCEKCYDAWLLYQRRYRLEHGIRPMKRVDLSGDPLTGTTTEIAKRNNCSLATVWKWMKNHGCPRRGPHRMTKAQWNAADLSGGPKAVALRYGVEVSAAAAQLRKRGLSRPRKK